MTSSEPVRHPDSDREEAILNLVQSLIPVLHKEKEEGNTGDNEARAPSSVSSGSFPIPQHYLTLTTGSAVYRVLHTIAPTTFTELLAMEEILDDDLPWGSGGSLKFSPQIETKMKGNLLTLIRHMNDHARFNLDAKRGDFNLTALVSASAVVQYASRASLPSEQPLEGEGQFRLLMNLFVAMVALSGLPILLNCLKSLPREQQKTLSDLTRETMHEYGLRGTRSSVDRRRAAAIPSRYTSPFASQSMGSVAPAVMEESTYFRSKNAQLSQEVEEWKSRVSALESKNAILGEECKNIEYKYHQLLNEVERDTAGETAALKTAVEKKTETIEALQQKLDEAQQRLKSVKQAAEAHQMQSDGLKSKIKQLEAAVLRMMEDRRELEQKNALLEDKLTARNKGFQELEEETERLRNELRFLECSDRVPRLTQEPHGDEPSKLANASFASNDSITRVLSLEKDLTDIRRQRDQLQKQVNVLQRQFASGASITSGSTVQAAAQDTLKAQVRQLERERQVLHRQREKAMERIQELESMLALPQGGGSAQYVASSKPAASEARESELVCDTERRPAPQTPRTPNRPTLSEIPNEGCPMSFGSAGEVPTSLTASGKRILTTLSSMLMAYAFQNVLLQQHDVLLFKDHLEGYRERARHLRRGHEANWWEDLAQPTGNNGGRSFLARQRRMVEVGLMESVVHHHIAAKK